MIVVVVVMAAAVVVLVVIAVVVVAVVAIAFVPSAFKINSYPALTLTLTKSWVYGTFLSATCTSSVIERAIICIDKDKPDREKRADRRIRAQKYKCPILM